MRSPPFPGFSGSRAVQCSALYCTAVAGDPAAPYPRHDPPGHRTVALQCIEGLYSVHSVVQCLAAVLPDTALQPGNV